MHVYMHTYLLASAYIYINIYMYTAVKKKKKDKSLPNNNFKCLYEQQAKFYRCHQQ